MSESSKYDDRTVVIPRDRRADIVCRELCQLYLDTVHNSTDAQAILIGFAATVVNLTRAYKRKRVHVKGSDEVRYESLDLVAHPLIRLYLFKLDEILPTLPLKVTYLTDFDAVKALAQEDPCPKPTKP